SKRFEGRADLGPRPDIDERYSPDRLVTMALTVCRVRRIYTVLTVVNSLAVSFIWSINSLLLFDAGLNNTQALTANACFTLGYALFQIPTGAIADTWGRRADARRPARDRLRRAVPPPPVAGHRRGRGRHRAAAEPRRGGRH